MGYGGQMADILAGQVKFLPHRPAQLAARGANSGIHHKYIGDLTPIILP